MLASWTCFSSSPCHVISIAIFRPIWYVYFQWIWLLCSMFTRFQFRSAQRLRLSCKQPLAKLDGMTSVKPGDTIGIIMFIFPRKKAQERRAPQYLRSKTQPRVFWDFASCGVLPGSSIQCKSIMRARALGNFRSFSEKSAGLCTCRCFLSFQPVPPISTWEIWESQGHVASFSIFIYQCSTLFLPKGIWGPESQPPSNCLVPFIRTPEAVAAASAGKKGKSSWKQMGVSINGGTPKWMVYKGKSFLKVDDFRGTPSSGNLQIMFLWKADHFTSLC